MWSENPVIGIGLDQVPTRTDAELQPHSVYVQAFVEMGTLGIALLIGLIVAAGRDLTRARRAALTNFDRWMTLAATAAALAFAIQMVSENLLTQVAIHLYLWIPLAYATALPRRPMRRLPRAAVTSPVSSTV